MQYSSPLHDRVTFRVPAHACDPQKQLRPPDLIREFQEAALKSTLRLGVSVFDLEPHRLGWVLLGQYLKWERPPRMDEPCTIVTCPTGFERVFTFRDFHLLDETGATIAVSSSTWMLMNLDTRRMARLPDWITALDADTPPREEQLSRADYQLLEVEPVVNRQFTVGYQQLDTNGHLTNPYYPEWMLEGLPYELLRSGELRQIRIQFKREARYGETLGVSVKEVGEGHFHHGLWSGADTLLATMESNWK